MMSLPDTRVWYGIRRSRLSTSRVRPPASAARIESSPASRTSIRRDGSASWVFCRSKEMRAGLSMVNDSGAVAGPDIRNVSCSSWPGRVCTSTASSLFTGSCAQAVAPGAMTTARKTAATRALGHGKVLEPADFMIRLPVPPIIR